MAAVDYFLFLPPVDGASTAIALESFSWGVTNPTNLGSSGGGAGTGKATPETFFGRLVAEFGASRIAWGSNFPASERSLPELVALGTVTLRFLPEADREWIFARTATTLYPALTNHQ